MPTTSPAEALDAIFKAYDVRGLCPGELDPTLAEAIGAGFAQGKNEDSDGARFSTARAAFARSAARSPRTPPRPRSSARRT